MLRKIVLVKGHEELRTAWLSRSFSMARPKLQSTISSQGLQLDDIYHPVRVPGKARFNLSPQTALGFDYRALAAPEAKGPAGDPGATYAVRANFDDEDAVERLKHNRPTEVAGVFADPTIAAFAGTYCGNPPVGNQDDAFRNLGGAALKAAALTGKKVRVAVVDTGIDGDGGSGRGRMGTESRVCAGVGVTAGARHHVRLRCAYRRAGRADPRLCAAADKKGRMDRLSFRCAGGNSPT